jgi:hypothetical protein
MGQSTEELTTQIEQTRARMTSDVDALQDKVSPSAIIDRRKEATRHKVSSIKERVMGVAHQASDATPSPSGMASSTQERVQGSPLAAGLVAFGTGLVVASLMPATKAEARAAHQTLEAAKEHGQPLVDEARSAAQQVAAQAKDQAAEAAAQVKESATDSAGTVKDEAQSSAEAVRSDAGA